MKTFYEGQLVEYLQKGIHNYWLSGRYVRLVRKGWHEITHGVTDKRVTVPTMRLRATLRWERDPKSKRDNV